MNRIGLSLFILALGLLPSATHAQQDPNPDVTEDATRNAARDAAKDAKRDTPPPAGEVKAFVLPPVDDLHATRERPLFAPERRPDEEPAAEPEPETQVVEEKPESLNFELTGVVMGTDMAIAILKNRDTQETVHLRQGENVETWSVEEIAQRRVVLRQDEKQVTLELFAAKEEGSEDAHPTPPPAINRPHLPQPPKTNRQQNTNTTNTNANQADSAMQRRNMQLRRQQRQQQMQRQEQLQEQRQDQRRAARRGLQQRRIQQNP